MDRVLVLSVSESKSEFKTLGYTSARRHLGTPQPRHQLCSRDGGGGSGGGNGGPGGAADWLGEHGPPECGRTVVRLRLSLSRRSAPWHLELDIRSSNSR